MKTRPTKRSRAVATLLAHATIGTAIISSQGCSNNASSAPAGCQEALDHFDECAESPTASECSQENAQISLVASGQCESLLADAVTEQSTGTTPETTRCQDDNRYCRTHFGDGHACINGIRFPSFDRVDYCAVVGIEGDRCDQDGDCGEGLECNLGLTGLFLGECVVDDDPWVIDLSPRNPRRAGKSSSCFESGTLVATPFGERSIESLEVGDKVFAFNFETKSIVARPITFRRSLLRPAGMIRLEDGTELRLTSEHPIYLGAEAGFVEASHAQVGDFMYSANTSQGDLVAKRIEAIEWQPDNIVKVHDISVAGDQNFFAEGVLVHNY